MASMVEPALLGPGVLGREEEVDAVGPAAGLVLDPVEVDLELLGGVGHRPEHAEAPGLGHRGHHVAAVAEGEDRELDAEQFGDGGVHGLFFLVEPAGSYPEGDPGAGPVSLTGRASLVHIARMPGSHRPDGRSDQAGASTSRGWRRPSGNEA